MENSKKLLVVCGPTASGKTGLAVELARRYSGEVVSADSMQIYRQMNIGTAKPSREEQGGIPHHLLDILEPDRNFSVAEYALRAREAIGDIQERGKLPILAGGTGLYIQAVVDNLQFGEGTSDPLLREQLHDFANENGTQALWERLAQVDPKMAESLHPNNLGRVIRAIEVYCLTGIPMSQVREHSRGEPGDYGLCMLGLRFADRENLYRRINQRVDEMLAQGLLDEARLLMEQGYESTAAQAIGYKELFPYLRGEQSLEQAVEQLKMQTRRYAKRQITWFRRDSRIHWLTVDEPANETTLIDSAVLVIEQAKWSSADNERSTTQHESTGRFFESGTGAEDSGDRILGGRPSDEGSDPRI